MRGEDSRRGLTAKLAGKFPITPRHLELLLIYQLTGLIVGLAIVGLSTLYSLLWEIAEDLLTLSWLPLLVLPGLGMAVSYTIIRRFAVDKSTGCGTHEVLEVYHFAGGNLPLRDALSKATASAITIGLGGSAGLEGPSLILGGGLASAIARKLKLSVREAKIMLLCGAAAGLSAIFKAPLTGIMFALEIPYQHELVKEAFVPAAMSSIVAYFLVVALTGAELLFPAAVSPSLPLTFEVVAHAIGVGLAAAACGVIFVKLYAKCATLARRGEGVPYVRAFVGGMALAAIGLLLPQSLGVGYESIRSFASGEEGQLCLLLALIVAKIIATAVTLNSGGSGGLFIPSIFVGTALGSAYSMAFLGRNSPAVVAAAAAATLAATSKTLLTGVAFVAETVGSSSVITALIASVVGYFASGRYSFYREVQPVEKLVEEEEDRGILLHALAKKGKLSALSSFKISDVMKGRPIALRADMKVKEALEVVKKHTFRVYPVVGRHHELLGYIDIEELFLMPSEGRDKLLSEVPLQEPLTALESDSLADVTKRMIEMEIDHVYVVSDRESMRLIGVVSGMDIVRKLIELT